MRRVQLGLIGCGVVGGGLIQLIQKNHRLIQERTGLDLVVRRALVRDLTRPRNVPGSEHVVFTDKPSDVIAASDIDIVVEVMGGTTIAREHVEAALKNGKNVVTANKALLATVGQELFALAASNGRCIGFEASVCAGLPVISAIRQSLVGNHIERLFGIVNGTTNFILTRMAEEGASLETAISMAQHLGFCEADPSLDIDGIDAAQKLVVLSELAFGAHVNVGDVRVQGIRAISAVDIHQADTLGYMVKHTAIAQRVDEHGCLDLSVQPVLLPKTHPLASVRNEFNAVLLHGDAVGDMVFQGKGAGDLPTASAVLADVVDVALREKPSHVPALVASKHTSSTESRFYLRFPVLDQPGSIGLITTILGQAGISISHANAILARNEGPNAGNVMILAHQCTEVAITRAVEKVVASGTLRSEPLVMRIIESE